MRMSPEREESEREYLERLIAECGKRKQAEFMAETALMQERLAQIILHEPVRIIVQGDPPQWPRGVRVDRRKTL
jgi:4'-phosphopantetheinyl transferase EntD